MPVRAFTHLEEAMNVLIPKNEQFCGELRPNFGIDKENFGIDKEASKLKRLV